MQVSPTLLKLIKSVCALPIESLREIVRVLDGLEQPIIKVSSLVDVVGGVTKNEASAGQLVSAIIRLTTFKRLQEVSAAETVEALKAGLEKDAGWSDSVENYSQHWEFLTSLVTNASICAAAKAVALIYDHERVSEYCRILTDIRPVFDENKETLLGAVVIQTLRIEYFDGQHFESISMAMDDEDVRRLEQTCAKALEKSKACQNLLSRGQKIEVFAAGEEKHGSIE